MVGYHEISEVWEDNLAPKVHAILDEKGVRRTDAIDVRLPLPQGASNVKLGVVSSSRRRPEEAHIANLLVEGHMLLNGQSSSSRLLWLLSRPLGEVGGQ